MAIELLPTIYEHVLGGILTYDSFYPWHSVAFDIWISGSMDELSGKV